jgi:hypothetical protein
VGVEAGLLRCFERAVWALEGLLPGVCSEVFGEVALPCCRVRAVWALEGLLPGVCSEMFLEVALSCCLVRAVWALEGLLPGVCSDVPGEVGLLCCLERAVWALEGLLSTVRSEMPCEGFLPPRLVVTFSAAVHDHGRRVCGCTEWRLHRVACQTDCQWASTTAPPEIFAPRASVN